MKVQLHARIEAISQPTKSGTIQIVCTELVKCLMNTNDEIILESARALGNIARDATVSVHTFDKDCSVVIVL